MNDRSVRAEESDQAGGQQDVGLQAGEISDARWDEYLESTKLGQFQQSSLWAGAKRGDGWIPLRRVLSQNGQTLGGFQILVRRTRLGRVGYVYKGPVVSEENEPAARAIIDLLVETSKAHRLAAVVVQPPDESGIPSSLLQHAGFLPNRLVDVISATLCVDLTPGLDRVVSGIRRTTQAEIRQARARGIAVRPGAEDDLPAFFDLMAVTCGRQNTTPSPPSASKLVDVWRAFQPAGKAQLWLAEFEGQAIAGLLCLCFGRKVVAWKKGWNGQHGERNPNQLVNFEAIRWACEHGYRSFDFDALDRSMAQALLQNRPLTPAQRKSRHYFNLAFGGRPLLFSESHLFIRNPAMRLAYRGLLLTGWSPATCAQIRGMVRRARHGSPAVGGGQDRKEPE